MVGTFQIVPFLLSKMQNHKLVSIRQNQVEEDVNDGIRNLLANAANLPPRKRIPVITDVPFVADDVECTEETEVSSDEGSSLSGSNEDVSNSEDDDHDVEEGEDDDNNSIDDFSSEDESISEESGSVVHEEDDEAMSCDSSIEDSDSNSNSSE